MVCSTSSSAATASPPTTLASGTARPSFRRAPPPSSLVFAVERSACWAWTKSCVSLSPPPSLLPALGETDLPTSFSRPQWYRGPFARAVGGPGVHAGGDIGFETGMAVAAVVFVPARWLEKRVFGR